MSGGAGASLGIGTTGAGLKGGASSSKQTTYGKQHLRNYDAQFALPINFLDLLTDKKLINNEPTKWAVSNIGLFKGKMTIAEISSLLPAMMDSNSGMGDDVTRAATVLNTMPPTAQGILVKGVTKVWSIYNMGGWVTHPSSLALTNGAKLDGQWALLGIVDAKPVKNRTKANQSLFPTAMVAIIEFTEVLKSEMGRPDNCYAFTPLLVFREVT